MTLGSWFLGIGLLGLGGLGLGGCVALAGLDGDYSVGEVGGGGVGASGAGGGTTSTGTTTSTNVGGSGASGGSGGGAAVEDCLDGVDNDGNSLIDCADPACQPDHECAPLPDVPTDWDGYFILDTVSYPSTSVSPCPDNNPPQVLFDGLGGAAQCSPCACGSVSGGSCTFPTMSRWKNQNDCTGTADDLFNPGNGGCYQFPTNCGATCSNDQRLQLVSQSTLSGSPTCPPSGGTATVPPMWINEHHLCHLPASGGGGCPTGEVCVSLGTSFGGACVERQGAHSCPTEWPKTLTAYADATDSRGCTSCACNAGGVSCTGGHFIISDDGACQGGTNPDITVSGTTCTSAQNHLDEYAGSYRAVAGTVTGTCSAQGGQPTGNVTPSGLVTVCCL